MPCTVEIIQASKRFYTQGREIKAVEKFDFSFNSGEITGILGPNGSGKTTLIKMICGLIIPTSGIIRVLGADTGKAPYMTRSSIGLITAEERGFYGRLSGMHNLEFFSGLYGLPPAKIKSRVEELDSLLNLGNQLKTPYQKYSSGNKQKLAIARALLHAPEILLIDELNKSLDHEFRPRFISFLRKMAAEDEKTIILTTHMLDEAEAVCDNAIIIDSGRIISSGPVSKLTDNGRIRLKEKYSKYFSGGISS